MSGAPETLAAGQAVLGIELGSTRIKAILTDPAGVRLGAGTHAWESHLQDGHWTYSRDEVDAGIRSCVADLLHDVATTHGVRLRSVAAVGVSAMMHGYLALDENDEWLVPFRTWRDTTTASAAHELTRALGVNIPQRWSVAHLYQAHLDGEPHLAGLARLTTLAGWVHRRLTGQHVLGVGDASGMFPVDPATGTWDHRLLERVDGLLASPRGVGLAPRRLIELLPRVLVAGTPAGTLTPTGALLLDPSGGLAPGALACPPEGDAGTGMVATDSVRPRSVNVSVGTSVFAMTVLERPWQGADPDIDVVCTPAGHPVAMVHANNGAGELDAWAGVFADFATRLGVDITRDEVFRTLLGAAADGASDAGGVVVHNFLAGEPVAGVTTGHPLLVRGLGRRLGLPDLVRAHVMAVFATLALGMRVLHKAGVATERVVAHGGVFRTEGVAQRTLAAALDTSVSVLQGAGEGGAWGMAVLAAFLLSEEDDLAGFLDRMVFADAFATTVTADPGEVAGFAAYLSRFEALLPLQDVAARVG